MITLPSKGQHGNYTIEPIQSNEFAIPHVIYKPDRYYITCTKTPYPIVHVFGEKDKEIYPMNTLVSSRYKKFPIIYNKRTTRNNFEYMFLDRYITENTICKLGVAGVLSDVQTEYMTSALVPMFDVACIPKYLDSYGAGDPLKFFDKYIEKSIMSNPAHIEEMYLSAMRDGFDEMSFAENEYFDTFCGINDTIANGFATQLFNMDLSKKTIKSLDTAGIKLQSSFIKNSMEVCLKKSKKEIEYIGDINDALPSARLFDCTDIIYLMLSLGITSMHWMNGSDDSSLWFNNEFNTHNTDTLMSEKNGYSPISRFDNLCKHFWLTTQEDSDVRLSIYASYFENIICLMYETEESIKVITGDLFMMMGLGRQTVTPFLCIY